MHFIQGIPNDDFNKSLSLNGYACPKRFDTIYGTPRYANMQYIPPDTLHLHSDTKAVLA